MRHKKKRRVLKSKEQALKKGRNSSTLKPLQRRSKIPPKSKS